MTWSGPPAKLLVGQTGNSGAGWLRVDENTTTASRRGGEAHDKGDRGPPSVEDAFLAPLYRTFQLCTKQPLSSAQMSVRRPGGCCHDPSWKRRNSNVLGFSNIASNVRP